MSRRCQHSAPCADLRFVILREEFNNLLTEKRKRLQALLASSGEVSQLDEARKVKAQQRRQTHTERFMDVDGSGTLDLKAQLEQVRAYAHTQIQHDLHIVETLLAHLDDITSGGIPLDLDDLMFLRYELSHKPGDAIFAAV